MINYRKTIEYKKMKIGRAVAVAEINGEADSEVEYYAAWQWLYDTKELEVFYQFFKSHSALMIKHGQILED